MSYEEFEEEVKVIGNLGQAKSFLGWDEEVMMPEEGVRPRSKQKSVLTKIGHERLTSDRLGELIDSVDRESLDDNQMANLREIERERERMLKVPSSLMEKISQKESECVKVWKEAKEEDDFESFAQELEELVELKREYANTIDSDKEPYKVLFEDYEPYLSFETMENVLQNLKNELVPLIDRIKQDGSQISEDAFKDDFDEEKEMDLNREMVEKMGFKQEEGRLDISAHPFTIGNAFDTRITTRIKDGDISDSLMPTIHEGGHALYNLGLPKEHYATPRGEARELSVHESQSRLWENHVGRSKDFWSFMLPRMKEKFPEQFGDVSVQDCYESINQVYEDNLIRVKADELSYHLHIILRFEIGRKLMNGDLEVDDLPAEWNERMEKYLGLVPDTDSEGVMQDIHWAWGNFGYFPTYTLGSVLSSQVYKAAEEDIGGLDEKIGDAEFEELREWLRENIHSKGKLLKTEELIEEVTGEEISGDPFIEYVKRKYSDIYGISL